VEAAALPAVSGCAARGEREKGSAVESDTTIEWCGGERRNRRGGRGMRPFFFNMEKL
jgi:hypothetical protein